MADKRFDKPVQIISGQHGGVVPTIDTTLQAVD